MKPRPNRLPSVNIRAGWHNYQFHVGVSLDPDTAEPVDVFYSDGMKSGTDLLHTVQDTCILLSLLMRSGVPLADVADRLSNDGVGAAIIAAVLEENA